MKAHADYRWAVLHSTYFDPNGRETLKAVNERFGSPINLVTVYRHMTRHQKKDILASERLAVISGEPSKNWQRQSAHSTDLAPRIAEHTKEIVANTEAIVEGGVPRQKYEVGLDEFIELGRDRLKHNEMAISASNYIAAIKVKADIESRTKDRRLEMMKSMFIGAAPKGPDEPKN